MKQHPFSQACERNKQPILEQLKVHLADASRVFEIGTGTAQHATFFAKHLPHLIWHTSDQEQYLDGINARLAEHKIPNITLPFVFRIYADKALDMHPWIDQLIAPPLDGKVDAVFTANTTHVMSKADAQQMMKLVAMHLPHNGRFIQYGPFNIDGKYTSESNRAFDEKIRIKGWGGIRDIAELDAWTVGTGMQLQENIAMPANNRLLIWTIK